MNTLNAKAYYDMLKSKTPRGAVLTAICSGADLIIDSIPDGEVGIRQFINWLLDYPMPNSLGLCDGSEFDTMIAQFIICYQNVLKHHNLTLEPIPEGAPKMAVMRQISPGVYISEGGSNRASEKANNDRWAREAEIKKLDCTDACKDLLARTYPDLGSAKKWKRGRRYTDSGVTVRIFQCGDVVKTVIFNPRKTKPLTIQDGNIIPDADPNTISLLKRAAATIKHCGDYGHLYFSPSTRKVWWCAGDADFGDDEDSKITSYDDVLSILKVSGVSEVEIEAEHCPGVDEGYISLGTFGKVVDLY